MHHTFRALRRSLWIALLVLTAADAAPAQTRGPAGAPPAPRRDGADGPAIRGTQVTVPIGSTVRMQMRSTNRKKTASTATWVPEITSA